MFLKLNHKNLEVYSAVRLLTKEVYAISNKLPPEEKFNMVQQLRRAALSVKLNLAEGSSRRRRSKEKRYYEISRGSIVEIDAAIETAVDLNYLTEQDVSNLGEHLNHCFALLSGMM